MTVGMFTRTMLLKLLVVALEALAEAFQWLSRQIKSHV